MGTAMASVIRFIKGQTTTPKAIRPLPASTIGSRIASDARDHVSVTRTHPSPAGMLAAFGKIQSRRKVTASVGAYLGKLDDKTRSR